MTQNAISISMMAVANVVSVILCRKHVKTLLTQIFAAKSNVIPIRTVTTIHFAHGTLLKTVANVLDHRLRVASEFTIHFNACKLSVILMEMATPI
jgi:hypothetical protein